MFGKKTALRDGFYLEMDDISVEEQGGRLTARQTPDQFHVSELMDMLRQKDVFLPAYLNRNLLASRCVHKLDGRVIFRGKQEELQKRMKKPERPEVSYPGEFEREQVRRDVEALANYEKRLAEYEAQEKKRTRITLMRCGMSVRMDGNLVALLILRDKNPVWRISAPADMNLRHLEGEIGEAEVLGEKIPEPEPLLAYLEEAYRELLPAGYSFDKVRAKL